MNNKTRVVTITKAKAVRSQGHRTSCIFLQIIAGQFIIYSFNSFQKILEKCHEDDEFQNSISTCLCAIGVAIVSIHFYSAIFYPVASR